MSDQTNSLRHLKQISQVDSKIAGILAERRRLEDEKSERLRRLRTFEDELIEKRRALKERQEVYRREDKHLREAQVKLIERRKALQTIGDYKTQVAAEREIDTVSRQLSVQEESLLKVMEQIEELEKGAASASEALESEKNAGAVFEKEAVEALVIFEERMRECTAEREQLVKVLPGRHMSVYERVRQKYPMDSVVALRGTTCTGCFLGLGPQTIVEISRGKDLVRCRGCGRILYLEGKEEE